MPAGGLGAFVAFRKSHSFGGAARASGLRLKFRRGQSQALGRLSGILAASRRVWASVSFAR